MDSDSLLALGIESSCDDTAAAFVRVRIEGGAAHGPGAILGAAVMGQDDLHADFGGVVPEIAARAHAERLDLCVERAAAAAGLAPRDADLIAVTAGPGLIGGVMAGVAFARGLAAGLGKPLIGVNHLEGHALTARLTEGVAAPYLLLLVSGGHCQILEVTRPCAYRRIGGSIDDAPGEAFDKAAKLLGLGQPGGPAVERAAAAGDPERIPLPRPLLDRPGCDMSFSGLKTALRRARDRLVDAGGGLTASERDDLAAAFQAAVADVLGEKTRRAMRASGRAAGERRLAVAGGVAANAAVRAALEAAARAEGFTLHAPPLALCTDNAAMIAWAGAERWAMGARGGEPVPRPRWPLDEAAPALIGGGRKGPRA